MIGKNEGVIQKSMAGTTIEDDPRTSHERTEAQLMHDLRAWMYHDPRADEALAKLIVHFKGRIQHAEILRDCAMDNVECLKNEQEKGRGENVLHR